MFSFVEKKKEKRKNKKKIEEYKTKTEASVTFRLLNELLMGIFGNTRKKNSFTNHFFFFWNVKQKCGRRKKWV